MTSVGDDDGPHKNEREDRESINTKQRSSCQVSTTNKHFKCSSQQTYTENVKLSSPEEKGRLLGAVEDDNYAIDNSNRFSPLIDETQDLTSEEEEQSEPSKDVLEAI